MDQQEYHIPALLTQAVESLAINPDGVYVDATFGGGGHSRAITDCLGERGHLYSFDQDMDAVGRAFRDDRFTMVHGNFKYVKNFLRFYGVGKVDGILADLGVSSHHFDDPGRGFSFRHDGPLDMRMNRAGKVTAASVVASYSEEHLADMFYLFGELKSSRRIASAIVAERRREPVATVGRFLDIVRPFVNPKQEKKELAQIFQSLRIEVNRELEALESLLECSLEVLKPGGRIVVITYHSLEDRLVKNFMKTGNFKGERNQDFYGRDLSPFRLLTSKPVVPDGEEVERNPRSRSAKMRVAMLKSPGD